MERIVFGSFLSQRKQGIVAVLDCGVFDIVRAEGEFHRACSACLVDSAIATATAAVAANFRAFFSTM
jgi:hypothetical protein